MKTVGVRALQQNASAVVAAAAAGEIITVIDRGRPVAQIVPLPSGRLGSLTVAGRARPPKRSLRDLGEAPRRGAGRRPLSEILDEMRSAERY